MPAIPDNGAITEWLAHQAASALRLALDERINWLSAERAGVFFPGEATRTQETIIEIEARLCELRAFASWLQTADQFRSEIDHAQHERILPGRVSGTC